MEGNFGNAAQGVQEVVTTEYCVHFVQHAVAVRSHTTR